MANSDMTLGKNTLKQRWRFCGYDRNESNVTAKNP
jgi:hypothetical protein